MKRAKNGLSYLSSKSTEQFVSLRLLLFYTGRVKMFKSYVGFIFLLSFFGPVILGPPMPTHGEKEAMCEKSALDGCLRKLQTFLRITTLPFTSAQKELDLLCEKALSGHNCSQMLYTNADCLLQKDKDMIPIFQPMAEYMYYMLCGNGKAGSAYLREDFLSNSDCIMKHKDQIECCAIETKVPNLPILHFLKASDKPLEQRPAMTCCPISRHLQCVSAVARDNCGEAALNFTTEYILRATGEQVQIVCEKIPDYPDTDSTTCPDPVKICSGAVAMQQKNIVSYFVLIHVLIWMSKKQFS